ncbi:MAG: hypothetical protein R2712_07345 [Vicinamibacterales bacterium]
MAAVVDRVGDELLARAVLTLDQHIGVAGRHRLHQLEQREHRLALAQDVLERVLLAHAVLQPQVLPALVHQVCGAIQQPEQAVGIQVGLLDEVEGAGLARLERALDRALPADDDDLKPLVDGLEGAEHVDAVGVREHEVEQHHRWLMGAAGLLGTKAGVGGDDAVPGHAGGLRDDGLQELDRRRIVIDDEDRLLDTALTRVRPCRGHELKRSTSSPAANHGHARAVHLARASPLKVRNVLPRQGSALPPPSRRSSSRQAREVQPSGADVFRTISGGSTASQPG